MPPPAPQHGVFYAAMAVAPEIIAAIGGGIAGIGALQGVRPRNDLDMAGVGMPIRHNAPVKDFLDKPKSASLLTATRIPTSTSSGLYSSHPPSASSSASTIPSTSTSMSSSTPASEVAAFIQTSSFSETLIETLASNSLSSASQAALVVALRRAAPTLLSKIPGLNGKKTQTWISTFASVAQQALPLVWNNEYYVFMEMVAGVLEQTVKASTGWEEPAVAKLRGQRDESRRLARAMCKSAAQRERFLMGQFAADVNVVVRRFKDDAARVASSHLALQQAHDSLASGLKARDEEIEKLRQELAAEQALRSSEQSKHQAELLRVQRDLTSVMEVEASKLQIAHKEKERNLVAETARVASECQKHAQERDDFRADLEAERGRTAQLKENLAQITGPSGNWVARNVYDNLQQKLHNVVTESSKVTVELNNLRPVHQAKVEAYDSLLADFRSKIHRLPLENQTLTEKLVSEAMLPLKGLVEKREKEMKERQKAEEANDASRRYDRGRHFPELRINEAWKVELAVKTNVGRLAQELASGPMAQMLGDSTTDALVRLIQGYGGYVAAAVEDTASWVLEIAHKSKRGGAGGKAQWIEAMNEMKEEKTLFLSDPAKYVTKDIRINQLPPDLSKVPSTEEMLEHLTYDRIPFQHFLAKFKLEINTPEAREVLARLHGVTERTKSKDKPQIWKKRPDQPDQSPNAEPRPTIFPSNGFNPTAPTFDFKPKST